MSRITPDPTPPSGKDELTFEQQQEIDRLAEKAYLPSSNSNKYRFALYAHIDQLIAASNQQAVQKARIADLVELRKSADEHGRIMIVTNTTSVTKRIMRLTAAQPRKDGDEITS